MGKVLVVTFDGLDYELIIRYGLEVIKQEEFGTLDNSTGVTNIITNELWACFITGKTWREHGVIGVNRPESDKMWRLEKFNRFKFFRKFMGLRRGLYKQIPFLPDDIRPFDKRDLEVDTIFEKVPNSKVIDVQSYSIGYNVHLLENIDSLGVKAAEDELERFTEWKKQELFDAIDEDFDLVMAHFHYPDHIHHWYWEVDRMDRVEEMYRQMDEFAEEILGKAEGKFDTIIFVSDHGLPEGDGHNKNAFYSCNHELFGDETPHITDFHDRILALVGDEALASSEVDDLDV